MSEISKKPEISEMKTPEATGFQEIKPQTDMSISEAKDFVNSLFKETHDTSDGYYNDYETRKSQTPVDGVRGQWEGERGESKYVPSEQTDAGKAAKDKLAEKDMDGIEYEYAEPDFSECAEATVEIDNMTEHRDDYYDAEGNYTSGNFSQADAKCADQSNAYHEYTSGFATSLVRSTCEMLFEQHCEGRQDIEWVYKNGDTGQQYFSIVYIDGIQHQWLFYADYIVMKKDGTVWVIETKGGEARGQDKNIDRQIENKFNAFRAYAAKHNLHWGFVRDKDNQLYINNTEFAEDMADDHWVPLTQEF